MSQQYTEFEQGYETVKIRLKKATEELDKQEKRNKSIISNKLDIFNRLYNKIMKETSAEIIEAKLDENYMPIINEGEYREASSAVPKRFMYYLTLLHMSLLDGDMLFPRFLLIDTPENLGIDNDSLDECISQIYAHGISELNVQYQVILTTGLGKYPDRYKDKVLQTLTKTNKLLIARQCD